MAGRSPQLSESAVIRSLRRFRDRYFPNSGTVVNDVLSPVGDTAEQPQPGYFDSLPVRQILIFILGNVFYLFIWLSKNMLWSGWNLGRVFINRIWTLLDQFIVLCTFIPIAYFSEGHVLFPLYWYTQLTLADCDITQNRWAYKISASVIKVHL